MKNNNDFDPIEWLNSHCGCDFQKAYNGDKIEMEKMKKHFDNETQKTREKYAVDKLNAPIPFSKMSEKDQRESMEAMRDDFMTTMNKRLREQERLGHPDFKNDIVKLLIEKYNFEIIEAKQQVFEKYSQLIEQDIEWSQHMGDDYWADIINERK